MKKLLIFMIAPLIMAASCKKDSGEEGASQDLIVGKWELASQTIAVPGEGEHTMNVPADARPSYWTFSSDGKLHVDGSYDFDHDRHDDAKADGSYSLSGKRLTLKYDNESNSFEVSELTADRLTLVHEQQGGSIALSFKKAR